MVSRWYRVYELTNAGDFQLSEVTAVAFSLVVTLTALEFESDALFTAELLNNLSCNCSTFDHWRAYCCVAAVVNEKYFVKRNFGINLRVEFLNVDLISCLNAVLFTACFENCVCHGLTIVNG